MRPLHDFRVPQNLKFVFCDIDDTLTTEGRLTAEAYQALENLAAQGLSVIPLTGRPAGWCEMIARFWPVAAVVGENGAFYFRYLKGRMKRHFAVPEAQRKKNRLLLDSKIAPQILREVPGAALASDQFCRISDLAIDFCEDVTPLSKNKVQRIVQIFEKHGATAKVSSIHVNGWFGSFDKATTSTLLLKREFGLNLERANHRCVFIGDSPNDEPLFSQFKNSFAVANIRDFISDLTSPPRYVTKAASGKGFVQFARFLLRELC